MMNEKDKINSEFDSHYSGLQSCVPAVRFEGFRESWKDTKMSECASVIGDGLHGTPKYVEESEIFFINGNNLVSGSIVITEDTKKVHETEQSKRDTGLGTNTILMSINGTIGNLALYRGEKVMLGKSVAYITLKDNADGYIYYCLQTKRIKTYFFNSLTGSTIKNLGLKAIRESTLFIPENRKEQTKIGNYFQQLDTLISQHQKKHDKLLTVKKALLEKLFPKQGEAEPEIRFKGFGGEWEEKSLGENAEFSKGQGYSKNDLSDSGTPIILYGRLYTQYQTTISEVDTFALNNGKSILSKGSEVIVPASGETAEDIARASAVVKSGIILGGDLNIVYPNAKLDPIFLALSISNGKANKDLSKRAQGKSVVHVRNNDLKEIDINYPHTKEQTQIGTLFQKLDTLITQHQTQLKKLNNIKQACLSKMFV